MQKQKQYQKNRIQKTENKNTKTETNIKRLRLLQNVSRVIDKGRLQGRVLVETVIKTLGYYLIN